MKYQKFDVVIVPLPFVDKIGSLNKKNAIDLNCALVKAFV